MHAEKQPSRWDTEGERGDSEKDMAKNREEIGGSSICYVLIASIKQTAGED